MPTKPPSPARLLLSVAILATAACTTTSRSSDVRVAPASTAARATPDTPAATPPPGSGADDPADDLTEDGTDDGTASTSEVPADQGDADWRDLLAGACTSLRTDGYETRKATVDAFRAAAEAAGERDAADDALADECAAAVERLEAARAVELRRDGLDVGDAPVTISGLRCDDGEYQFVATNETDHAIGVHVGFRLFVGDDDDPVGSADYPIVIWRLEPGGRQGITGEFEPPTADGGYRCNVLARVFDATDAGADAGLPELTEPGLTGDDPANWFGTLLAREVDAVGSGDPDAAAVTEDIRSTFYDNVLALNTGSEPAERVPSSVTICSGTVDRPEPDLVSFVYFVRYPDADGSVEGLLRHGLFRRGSDGQWRWLSAAHYFDSPDFWECGKPGRQS